MTTKDVSDLLSELPLGNFQASEFMRQVTTWICLSIADEVTPYTFPGLHKDFDLDESGLSYFSMAFQLGSLLGTSISVVLLDHIGRQRTCILMSPLCVLFAALMVFAQTYWQLVSLRVFLSTVSCLVLLGGNTWYAEFLPTKRRGSLIAAISFGWPLGRGLVIVVAKIYSDQWRPLMVLVLVANISLMLLCFMMV